jgi:hypothetical protein
MGRKQGADRTFLKSIYFDKSPLIPPKSGVVLIDQKERQGSIIRYSCLQRKASQK